MSNGASTAWALSAFSSLGDGGSDVAQHARAYLETLAQSDGSFSNEHGGEGSVLATAYIIIALSGKGYPVRKMTKPKAQMTNKTQINRTFKRSLKNWRC